MPLAYLKIFIRHLLGHKLFSVIIIGGLSVGLASCLVLALYINDELSFDRHHPNAEKIYRISSIFKGQAEILPISTNSPQVSSLLANAFTEEIEESVRLVQEQHYFSRESAPDTGAYEPDILFADENVFSFFSYDWLAGDPASALNGPDSIVLTESFAEKYFGSENPLGQTLLMNTTLPLRVTGIIRDDSGNSHLQADALASMAAYLETKPPGFSQGWFQLLFFTYIKFAEEVDARQIMPSIHDYIVENRPPRVNQLFDPDSQALTDIYLSEGGYSWSSSSRADEIVILAWIGSGLLLIGCINFINLATARTTDRLKEIAIRKVAGSQQRQIFLQHIGESAAMVLAAFFLALGITELLLPAINTFTGKNLATAGMLVIWPVLAGLGLLVVVLAGTYPAVYLSKARPLSVLRQKSTGLRSRFSLRNLLVICQFSIAIAMIIATLVMMRQVEFATNYDPGFDRDRVLVIDNKLGDDWQLFKQELQRNADMEMVSAGVGRPYQGIASSMQARYEGGSAEAENLSQLAVDFGFFELFDVELLTGRYLSENIAADRMALPTEENPHPPVSLLINLAMAESLGWTQESALGKWFELSYSNAFEQSVMGEIVGVIDNMQFDSVRRAVVPQFYFVPARDSAFNFAFVKLRPGNTVDQVEQISEIWSDVYPQTPMNQYFVDSTFQQLYDMELRQTGVVSAFAVLTIVISCLGLLGLAAYTTEKRIKEIGIRKVMGATVMQIVRLLSYNFSKLVLIANLIAWPAAYFAMNRWLENFAYRIDLTPMIFIGSGLIALCIAWVTVGGTAAKAASRKPVLALRYE